VFEGKRLVYYREEADKAFWDGVWQSRIKPETYHEASRGDLGIFEDVFTKYLPKDGKIIEAGCGIGSVLLGLKKRGYDCQGVEWGEETVKSVLSLYPDLPIRVGDVTKLDVPDNYYKGYISLGVVEHRKEGPELFLNEAYRILADDGVMIISVPFFHFIRRLKARVGLYPGRKENCEYYQCAFSQEEIIQLIEKSGFRVETHLFYSLMKGLTDEIPILRYVFKIPILGGHLKKLLESSLWLEKKCSHMIMFICYKKKTERNSP